MANYRDIHGFQIEIRSDNPSNPIDGQVWYNTTDSKLRGAAVTSVGGWATAATMNRGKYAGAGAGASNTSALFFGGNYPPGDNLTAETEQYDGTSWTEVGDLNTARQNLSGNGVATSALAYGGFIPPGNTVTDITESWNNSAWTEVADLNTGRVNLGSAGVSNTSNLAIGGDTYPGSNPERPKALTESWNGTSWTEVADLNTARFVLAGAGTATNAIAFGGYDFGPNYTAKTESWNGSGWTEVADLNTARYNHAGAGASNTSALAFGGTPPVTGKAESWNGTSWSEENDLNAARADLAGDGTATSALAFSGSPPIGGQTEEWAVPFTSTREFTLS